MVNLPVINMVRTEHSQSTEAGGIICNGFAGCFRLCHAAGYMQVTAEVALPTIDNLVVLAAVLQVWLDDILVMDTAAQVQISA